MIPSLLISLKENPSLWSLIPARLTSQFFSEYSVTRSKKSITYVDPTMNQVSIWNLKMLSETNLAGDMNKSIRENEMQL